MSDKKLSVDDILEEIEQSRAKQTKKAPNSDLGRVDDIIRAILEKRQDEQLQKDGRELTEKERQSLEKELKSQTRSLSKQFEKLQKEKEQERKKKADEFARKLHIEPDAEELSTPAREMTTSEIKLNRIQAEQQVKLHQTQSLPPEREEAKKKKYDELKKSANTQHIRTEMENISSYFGNYTMDDSSVDESYARLAISPTSYKELKKNRSQKIDSFMKESILTKPKEDAEAAEATAQEPAAKPVPDKATEETNAAAAKVQEPQPAYEEDEIEEAVFGYEYTDSSQTGKVRADLEKRVGRLKISLTILGAIGVNALLFSFVGKSNAALLLFGKLPVSPLLYALIALVLLVGALGAGYSIFKDAYEAFQNRRPTKDYLFLLTALVCLGVNLAFCVKPELLLYSNIHLYTPAAILALFFVFVSKYQQASLALKNFQFLSGNKTKYAVVHVEDQRSALELTKGGVDEDPCLVCNREAVFLDGFLTEAFRPDTADTLCKKMLWVVVPLALLLGVGGFLWTGDWGIAFTMLSGTMVLCSGFIGAVAVSLPFFDSASFARSFAGMMPSYGATEEFCDTNAILVDGYDLFPEDTVIMHGIKTFQGNRIDTAIVDAASVLCSARSVLQHVFLNIIGGNRALLKPVDSTQYEDLMGLSAWVDDRRVLIGNRELMINHSIAVPKQSYEEKYQKEGCEVIYLATGGELCAAFILEFTAGRRAGDAVRLLQKYHLLASVRSVDACLTADLLGRVFHVDSGCFKVLPSRLHAEYSRQHTVQERMDAALGNNGAPLCSIVLIAIAKKLRNCVRFGKLLYLLGTICSLLLFAAALLLGQLPVFGCWQVICYLGVILGLYWLYERNMRL